MKYLLFPLLLISSLHFVSCSNDEPEPEPEPEEKPTPGALATINGEAFSAEAFGISTAISGENYQITAYSEPQSIVVYFYGLPEVKTYTLTDDPSASGVGVTWASDFLSSTTNHRMEEGTLTVTYFEDNLVEATFSGKAYKVTDPDTMVEITDGKVVAQFPK